MIIKVSDFLYTECYSRLLLLSLFCRIIFIMQRISTTKWLDYLNIHCNYTPFHAYTQGYIHVLPMNNKPPDAQCIRRLVRLLSVIVPLSDSAFIGTLIQRLDSKDEV